MPQPAQYPNIVVSSVLPSAHSSKTNLADDADSSLDRDNDINVRPMDRGIGAWLFCLSACLLEMIIYGFCFSYGILQDWYLSHPPFNQQSPVSIAAVGPTAIALQYIPSLLISCFFARYPDYMRITMWTGLFLSFVSLFCSSWATKVWQLILLHGIVYGTSGGLIYVPVLMMITEWFDKRRGLATGIIFAGAGVGGFAFPYILNGLLNRVGLPWTLRIWALSTTVLAGISMLGVRPRLPTRKFNGPEERPRFFPSELVWIKKPLFWVFGATLFLQGVAFFPVSLYIATFTRELTNPLTATIVLSIFNSSAVGGQVLLGHLTDRISYIKVMFVSCFLSALAAFFLWGFASTAAQLYVFTIIFGVLSGGFGSTWASAGFDIANHRSEFVGLAISSGAAFKGISAVVGPVVSGILLEAGKGSSLGSGFGRNGYGAVEIFVGACSLAAAVGSLFVGYLAPPSEPKKSEGETRADRSAEKDDECQKADGKPETVVSTVAVEDDGFESSDAGKEGQAIPAMSNIYIDLTVGHSELRLDYMEDFTRADAKAPKTVNVKHDDTPEQVVSPSNPSNTDIGAQQ